MSILRKVLRSTLSKEAYSKYVPHALAGARLGALTGAAAGVVDPREGENRLQSALRGAAYGGTLGAGIGAGSRAVAGALDRTTNKVLGNPIRTRRTELLGGAPHSTVYSSAEAELEHLNNAREQNKTAVNNIASLGLLMPTVAAGVNVGASGEQKNSQ